MDACNMFRMEEEEVERLERENRINTVRIGKVIRKVAVKRNQAIVVQESGPDFRVVEMVEVDQIVDKNGNQLQSIVLKREEVECDLFSLWSTQNHRGDG